MNETRSYSSPQTVWVSFTYNCTTMATPVKHETRYCTLHTEPPRVLHIVSKLCETTPSMLSYPSVKRIVCAMCAQFCAQSLIVLLDVIKPSASLCASAQKCY